MRWWQVSFQLLTEDVSSFCCWCECRFCPQVHRFMRGRTIRKRREKLTAERRTQSVTRVDVLPNKVRNLTQTQCCCQGLVNYERILTIELSRSQTKRVWSWCILHSPFLKFKKRNLVWDLSQLVPIFSPDYQIRGYRSRFKPPELLLDSYGPTQ